VRRVHVIAIAVVAALAVVVVGGAWAYDRGHQDTIVPGVKIAGVDVGGLTAAQAKARVEREVLDPLREPIVVKRGTRAWHLGSKEAQISANIAGSVGAAMDSGRDGSFLARTWRSLTGAHEDANLEAELSYDDHAVVRLIDRVRRVVDKKARDASVTFSGNDVEPVADRPGRKLQAAKLHRDIRAAILSPTAERTFAAHTRYVEPKVTTAELGDKYPTLIIVNRSGFRLTLFHKLKRVKTYKIAVGRAGLETPAGLYQIQDKQVNPSWHVPNSAWAGDLAGKVIPPGPDDPIKARWMGLFDGAGIHGTTDIASLGSAASHGCVRMAIPDVEDLYDRVDVGTPVYIA
jgi:lipoprotein-anchoring transpeptidase ErfK/SrfK